MVQKNNRLRELDFLRGIAILLVLLRHQYLFQFTKNMGWIGVDLFFVLSGFLVSGLLFKEYRKYGDIKPKLFLIRRGFKIYPIYFLFYFLYITPILIKHKFVLKGFLSDMFFIQNYVWGWGYAYVPSWSLAVEEHFYFGFAILLYLAIKKNIFDFKITTTNKKLDGFVLTLIGIMISCLIMRIISNVYFPDNGVKNFTMSHLRMDSLLTGVLISYLYYFKNEYLTKLFNSYKFILIVISVLLASFTPFINPEESFFAKTFGFSFLYVSFGILLTYFLISANVNKRLDSIFSKPIVNIVSKIGFSSYSIYIIHGCVNYVFALINAYILNNLFNQTLTFVFTSIISVLCGMFMTVYIEKYFLAIRDKFYPSRIN